MSRDTGIFVCLYGKSMVTKIYNKCMSVADMNSALLLSFNFFLNVLLEYGKDNGR